MGSSLSRGTTDVIFILFPFVLSAGLIIMIVVCWWKCKILVDHRRGPGHGRKDSFEGGEMEEPNFGHLINIQEYAENQVGTTILYADSPGSSFPHPYVYFSDGRITRIVPLSPTSMAHALNQSHEEEEIPSTICNNTMPRNNNINNNENLRLQLPSSSSSTVSSPNVQIQIQLSEAEDNQENIASTSTRSTGESSS